jgi:hypothetical protein
MDQPDTQYHIRLAFGKKLTKNPVLTCTLCENRPHQIQKVSADVLNRHHAKEHDSCCFRGEFKIDPEVREFAVVEKLLFDLRDYTTLWYCPVVSCYCAYNAQMLRCYDKEEQLKAHCLARHDGWTSDNFRNKLRIEQGFMANHLQKRMNAMVIQCRNFEMNATDSFQALKTETDAAATVARERIESLEGSYTNACEDIIEKSKIIHDLEEQLKSAASRISQLESAAAVSNLPLEPADDEETSVFPKKRKSNSKKPKLDAEPELAAVHLGSRNPLRSSKANPKNYFEQDDTDD